MSIWQRNLDGQSKLDIAIGRIKAYCTGRKTFVAFSGGKDSQACYELAKMAGIPFDARYKITRFEPPELMQFIRARYPDVQMDRSYKKSLVAEIAEKGLPSRWARWCCVCKHSKTPGYDIAVLGVRAEESARRRDTWRIFGYKPDKTAYICPIFDWSVGEVWEFLNWRGVKHCALYDAPDSMERIGCVCCPLSWQSSLSDSQRWPKTAQMLRMGADKFVARMRAKNWHTATGRECGDWCKAKSPEEEYWQRWLHTGQSTRDIDEFRKWTNGHTIIKEQCAFEGSGFSNLDAGEESEL